MGTTHAFYHIQNRGFDRAQLQDIMKRSFTAEDQLSSHDQFVARLVNFWGEGIRQKAESWAAEFGKYLLSEGEYTKSTPYYTPSPQLPSPIIGYRPDAPWLPFFDRDICEGYNASSRDARKLSGLFGAPVLAISIFDSDILFVSYSDAAKGVDHNYATPGLEEVLEDSGDIVEMMNDFSQALGGGRIMEDHGMEPFQTEFPAFLLELCPALTKEKLTEIWEGEEVFADDRMYKLGEILGLSPINGAVPEGFEIIKAD